MSWGNDILTNGDASSENTTGWTIPTGSVDVEENTTLDTRYIPFVDDRSSLMSPWIELSLEGAAGDFCFVFASDTDVEMYQVMYASDIGDQPNSFQFVCSFKLTNAQELYDTTVKGFGQLKIVYSDGTKDAFLIPFIRGSTYAERNLFNFWLLVQNTCIVDSNKTLDYIEVRFKTFEFDNLLKVDYVEIRKEE